MNIARGASAAAASKAVHVTSSNGEVAEAKVTVSKVAGDQVTWFSYGNQPATVTFSSADGSPFYSSSFQIPAGGSVSSGPVQDAVPGKGQSYKYTVIGRAGQTDPVVVIDP